MSDIVGTKVSTICKNHNDAIVYYNNDVVCPFCVSKEIQRTIQEDYEILEEKYNTATGNCAGGF